MDVAVVTGLPEIKVKICYIVCIFLQKDDIRENLHIHYTVLTKEQFFIPLCQLTAYNLVLNQN